MSKSVRTTSIVLLGLSFCVVVVPLLAGWLNGWSLYAFPLGTLATVICVPVAMLVLVGYYIGVIDAPVDTDDAS